MRTYTVHVRAVDDEEDAGLERVFVKDGFCWPALFIPLIWLLYRSMWLPLLGWLAVGIAIVATATLWPELERAVTIFALLFALWFAFEANGLRRWSLSRKGFEMVDVASGRNLVAAELSHFHRDAIGLATVAASAPRRPTDHVARRGPAHEPVLGLFPEGRR